MSGYVLANVEWTDEEGHAEYLKLLGPSLEAFGGETLARSPDSEVMEGDWHPEGAMVLITFPSRESATNWYHSNEYSEALAIRLRSGRARLLIFGD